MDEQELNRKLAEWAGFREIEYQRCSCHPDRKGYYWHDFDKDYLPECPDFTQSLDACFEWLVPKLIDNYRIELAIGSKGTFCYIFKYGEDYSIAKYLSETPALALCLAISKLIDQE